MNCSSNTSNNRASKPSLPFASAAARVEATTSLRTQYDNNLDLPEEDDVDSDVDSDVDNNVDEKEEKQQKKQQKQVRLTFFVFINNTVFHKLLAFSAFIYGHKIRFILCEHYFYIAQLLRFLVQKNTVLYFVHYTCNPAYSYLARPI